MKFQYVLGSLVGVGALCSPANAQDSATSIDTSPPTATAQPKDPLRFAIGDGSLKVSIEAGAQYVLESNAFWNLSDGLAPTENYDTDPHWGEGYIEAGVKFEQPIGKSAIELGLSAVAAQTFGTDIFEQKNRGRLVIENAYAAVRLGFADGSGSVSFSGGAQPYKVGNGMLIGDGGVDGFERGAVIFGPRSAWAQTAIAKLQLGNFSVEGFHLNPRELDSSDSRTIVNGAKTEMKIGPTGTVGLSYGHVPRSEAPYIQAAPGGIGAPNFIFNGRDGLSYLQGWFKWSPVKSLPGFYIAGDYARQRNSRIDLKASAGRIEIGNTFIKYPWMPTLSYSFQTFSGDDPDTPELERFDPLFYDGSQNGWASGTNGSFVFINSNVNAHKLTLNFLPSQKDIVTLRVVTIAANNLRSPLQFGQATRPSLDFGDDGLIAGVTKRHLSNDILIEYTRLLSQNIFMTGGVGHSWTGSGLRTLTPGLKDWTGAFLNLVVQY
jgi:hypothetical protein